MATQSVSSNAFFTAVEDFIEAIPELAYGAVKVEFKVECWGFVFESVGDRDVADAAYKDVLKGGA